MSTSTEPFTDSGLNFPLSQAVELDETDVSLWLQMGRIALEVDNFLLASQAFQEVCSSWEYFELHSRKAISKSIRGVLKLQVRMNSIISGSAL